MSFTCSLSGIPGRYMYGQGFVNTVYVTIFPHRKQGGPLDELHEDLVCRGWSGRPWAPCKEPWPQPHLWDKLECNYTPDLLAQCSCGQMHKSPKVIIIWNGTQCTQTFGHIVYLQYWDIILYQSTVATVTLLQQYYNNIENKYRIANFTLKQSVVIECWLTNSPIFSFLLLLKKTMLFV